MSAARKQGAPSTPTERSCSGRCLTTEHATGPNPGAQHVESAVLGGVVHDTTNWCLGRPASTQVTRQHSLPGGAPVTRSLAHAWDYLRCRATQQTIEPSSTTLRVTTDFAYDAYGNVGTVSVTPASQPVRTTSYAWIDNGRFLGRATNAEGHVETMTWDAALATPTSVTDPNGLVTTLQHDPLGRLVQQVRPDGTSLALARDSCGATCARSGTAISNMYPEARSVGLWLRHGWHVAVAYVVGFFALLLVLGWHPHEKHKVGAAEPPPVAGVVVSGTAAAPDGR